VADTSGKAGITSTPTVKINGKDVKLSTPEALVAEIKAAKS